MATTRAPAGASRRWAVLLCIGLAQLMIILDATVVNIALPSLQRDLGISDGDRQWVITAYTLAFGGLLLLGGRIADYTGRKRTFRVALLGFTAASALGGAANGFETLLVARALQGGFGALLGPAALSLLTVTFTEPKERAKAFGIWGGIAAAGGALGLLAGGALTEYLDWRWCLYANIPIALAAAIGGKAVLTESRRAGGTRFDVPGVLLVTSGLVAIVYAAGRAESDGFGSAAVIGLLAAGAVLLAAFGLVESRAAQPLLPPRIIADRTRGGAYLAVGIVVIGMFGAFLFMTYYMQVVQGYSPVRTGAAFLPMTAAVLLAAGGLATRLLPKAPPRALIVPGMLLSSGGMLWLLTLEPGTAYASGVLVVQLLCGFGAGMVMPGPQRRHPRRRRGRLGRGLGDRQHRAADRRLDRHRGAQHHRRRRDRRPPGRARHDPGRRQAGGGRGVRGGGRLGGGDHPGRCAGRRLPDEYTAPRVPARRRRRRGARAAPSPPLTLGRRQAETMLGQGFRAGRSISSRRASTSAGGGAITSIMKTRRSQWARTRGSWRRMRPASIRLW